MRTVVRAASTASPILSCATGKSHSQPSQCGNGWLPTTLSMITLIGHGPARLIAVSTSMAANTIASQPRYGRIRSRMNADMLALLGRPGVASAARTGRKGRGARGYRIGIGYGPPVCAPARMGGGRWRQSRRRRERDRYYNNQPRFDHGPATRRTGFRPPGQAAGRPRAACACTRAPDGRGRARPGRLRPACRSSSRRCRAPGIRPRRSCG